MARHSGKYVSYLRVSTAKQEQSGLGLKAQRAAVMGWLNGGRWKLVDEIVEIESGKSDKNRPALQKALDACRRYKAKLIISRLDRLSRDPVFLLSLRDAGIEFVALDLPQANRLTIGKAMVAEQEREALSARTTAALAVKKAQGVKLGNPRPETLTFNDRKVAKAAAKKAGETVREQADQFAELIRPLLEGELAGLSANAAAKVLNERGVGTARGGQWTARAVIHAGAVAPHRWRRCRSLATRAARCAMRAREDADRAAPLAEQRQLPARIRGRYHPRVIIVDRLGHHDQLGFFGGRGRIPHHDRFAADLGFQRHSAQTVELVLGQPGSQPR